MCWLSELFLPCLSRQPRQGGSGGNPVTRRNVFGNARPIGRVFRCPCESSEGSSPYSRRRTVTTCAAQCKYPRAWPDFGGAPCPWRALTILGAFEEARSELVGKAVILTNGKAGAVENVWLDEVQIHAALTGLSPDVATGSSRNY
jgi:hypothetical protein